MPDALDKSAQKVIWGILILILLVVAVEQLALPRIVPDHGPEEGVACEGEPIFVQYPYGGGLMGPHECKVQCEDDIWRHIMYSDGQATQCQKPPGCSDQGEDMGVTCIPQLSS